MAATTRDDFVTIRRDRLHKVETVMHVSKAHIGDRKLAEQQAVDAVARQVAELMVRDGNVKTDLEPWGDAKITCTVLVIRKAQ